MTLLPQLLTEAAHGGLKPSPTGRLRRVLLHLSYSMALSHLLDTTPPRLLLVAACGGLRSAPALAKAIEIAPGALDAFVQGPHHDTARRPRPRARRAAQGWLGGVSSLPRWRPLWVTTRYWTAPSVCQQQASTAPI